MGSIVTVDGPAGSGKTTLGTRLAQALGLRFVDTGLFYRAVTAAAVRAGASGADDQQLAELARATRIEVDTHPGRQSVRIDGAALGAELHDPRHAQLLARISSISGVREALLPAQRAAAGGRAVAAGRDCGTVVFPDAPVKLFLHAPEHIREARRAAQLRAGTGAVDQGLLDDEVALRDLVDSTRASAPLQRAHDAHILDSGALGIEQLLQRALDICRTAGLAAA